MLSSNVSARWPMIKKQSLTDNAKQRIAQFLKRSHSRGRLPLAQLSEAFANLSAVGLLSILSWICGGCGARIEQPSQVPGPALYGAPAGNPSPSIPRVGPDSSAQEWTNASFACMQTELSPATLFHC